MSTNDTIILGIAAKSCFEIERNLPSHSLHPLFSHSSFSFEEESGYKRADGWWNLLFQCNSIPPPFYPFYPCSLLRIQVDLYIYPPSSISEHSIPSSGFHSPRVFPSCRGVYPDAFQLRAHLEDIPREKRTSS